MQDNQHEQLFTELTPAEAAVVEGGGSFKAPINFDSLLTSRQFKVKPGGTISLFSDTKSGERNREFFAAIRNVDTGRKNEKPVSVGKDTTKWTSVRGGNYVIDFTDSKDRVNVTGDIRVIYT